MSELIDRQAALDAIKFAELGREYDEVEKVQIFNPWHRVEEPPKEEGRYLVASRWGKDNRWSYDLAYYTTKLEKCYFLKDGICGAGWHMWSSYEYCDIRVFPDYWMPIEPPKEDA